ncbi:MAG TPA: dTMP kinase [Candidatus Eremiobacteraeota bacterium]|nr:MAG: Thymidylate kinase [bacterium ADurb.Bin363]HPZ10142.1 dTMP kinase [Candidatus Eremiobacteraeota bacterium]
MSGIFISFEGLEGAGKSTQHKKLCAYLEKKNIDFISSSEPGGTEIGRSLRNVLIDNRFNNMESLTEVFLFSASRYQHVCEVIKDALQKGYMVITDRYVDSTIAYQSYGRGLDINLIKYLNEIATDRIYPHITFLLDITPEKSIERLLNRVSLTHKKLDRIEEEKLEFFQRVREGYLFLAKAEVERFKVIDAREDVDTIHRKIIRHVGKVLKKSGNRS